LVGHFGVRRFIAAFWNSDPPRGQGMFSGKKKRR